jgi:uncharacterized membrane protein YidH (DUF202 family)
MCEYSKIRLPGAGIVTETGNLYSQPAKPDAPCIGENEGVHIARIQLILAEKRTSLAVLRTGIVVFTLPISVVTVLIATSRYYDFLETYHLIVPLLILCGGLVILAVYLINRSVTRIRKHDALITRIKAEDPCLAQFFEAHL